MPREFPRTRRVEAQLQRELTRLMRDAVKDPRAATATVTDVEVSRDMAHARVHVSVLELEQGPDEAVAALNRAAGFLRRELGRELRLRVVPVLRFIADNSAAHGHHMANVIDRALTEDRHKASDHLESGDEEDGTRREDNDGA